MVYIVMGPIDSGKTRAMEKIFKEKGCGDGFISKKVFHEEGELMGYEIVHLKTGRRMPLAYKTHFILSNWDEIFSIGPFSFSQKAVHFAEEIIDETCSTNNGPVFIDEIGPLELNGKGFCDILEKVLKTGMEIYISVRSHLVDAVVARFEIRDYTLLKIGSATPKTFIN